MVQEFIGDKAHDEFQAWRQDNPTGFFVNCKTQGSWMLHRVTCPHPGGTDWRTGEWGNLTKRRKICSTDRQELLELARQKGISALTRCSDCKP